MAGSRQLHLGAFMRPISIPWYVFFDTVGQTGFAVLQIIPALALALLIVHVDAPSSIAAFAALRSPRPREPIIPSFTVVFPS